MSTRFLTDQDQLDMVLNTPQELSQEQKAQARTNIGAIGADELTAEVEAALTVAKESGEFDGPAGPQGAQGPQGVPGGTPVRGVDYWTAEDQAKILQDVQNSLPASQGMELIREFQLEETVNGIDITTDDAGNTFRLDAAIVTVTTSDAGPDGSSGAFSVNMGTAADLYVLRLYSYGFDFHGWQMSEGHYRSSGFTAYASVKNRAGLAIGHSGDFGAALNNMDYVGQQTSGYCGDIKIERIQWDGNMPANATVRIYGERAAE